MPLQLKFTSFSSTDFGCFDFENIGVVNEIAKSIEIVFPKQFSIVPDLELFRHNKPGDKLHSLDNKSHI